MNSNLKPGTSILIMKPKMTRSFYELIRREETIGSITFTKPFGTLAEVKLFDEEWSLKRMGFWKPYITVRRKDDTQDYFQVPFSGKWQGLLTLTTHAGDLYELSQTGLWNPKWVWMKQNTELMEFDLKHGMKKYAELIVREQDAMMNMLLIVGAYGMIMQGWDDGASAAAITAAIG
jgi:hypothetical protein